MMGTTSPLLPAMIAAISAPMRCRASRTGFPTARTYLSAIVVVLWPEQVSEHVRPDARRRRSRHDRAPQVVQAHILESGPLGDTGEVLAHRPVGDGSVRSRRERPPVDPRKVGENRERRGWQVVMPPARLRLRHHQPAGVEIHVLPLESR